MDLLNVCCLVTPHLQHPHKPPGSIGVHTTVDSNLQETSF